jgi:hypothetical protein
MTTIVATDLVEPTVGKATNEMLDLTKDPLLTKVTPVGPIL